MRPSSAAVVSPMRSEPSCAPATPSCVVPIPRGDCTVHNERVMHGSGGNDTAGFRRAYVVAYRSRATRSRESSAELGFTHSHNDDLEVLDDVGVDGETRA